VVVEEKGDWGYGEREMGIVTFKAKRRRRGRGWSKGGN
jgi:hypothetical protein